MEKSLPNSNIPPFITEIFEPAPICTFPFIIMVPLFSNMLLEYRQSTVPTLCFPILNIPEVKGVLNIILPLAYLYSFTPRYIYIYIYRGILSLPIPVAAGNLYMLFL